MNKYLKLIQDFSNMNQQCKPVVKHISDMIESSEYPNKVIIAERLPKSTLHLKISKISKNAQNSSNSPRTKPNPQLD